MKRVIVLDSTPLGLLVLRQGMKAGDECRAWLARHIASGARAFVPEIIDYEIRRELIRLRKSNSIAALDAFNVAWPDRFLPLTSKAMKLAAELWARARQRGVPTADRHALDVDVILAAQVLSLGLPASDLVIATSNVAHLSQFVPAEHWASI